MVKNAKNILERIEYGMNDFESMLMQIVSAISARLLLLDNDGIVLAATDSCLQQVLGRSRDEVLNKPCTTVLGLDIKNNLDAAELEKPLELENALNNPCGWRGNLHLPSDGRFAWQVVMKPLLLSSGLKLAELVIFDDSLRQAALLDDYLLKQNQMAQAQELVHVAKNMLLSLGGSVQVAMKKCELQNVYVDSLPRVYEDLQDMALQFNNFLQVGNAQNDVEDASLNQLVAEAAREQQTNFTVNMIKLQTSLAEDIPQIKLDKRRLKQVLQNCLDNSRAAILQKGQSGGWVRISTQFDKTAGVVRLLVEDNGVGLDTEQVNSFFKPYHTTKEGGSGIGNCISQSIVRLHGGQMLVSGQPGEGCQICIELPLAAEQQFDIDDLYAEIASLGL